MIHPGGRQTPKDLKLEIKEIKKGLFTVENAYEGDDEYFPPENNQPEAAEDDSEDEKDEKAGDLAD